MILFHNSIPYRRIDLHSRERFWTLRHPFLVISLTVHVRRLEDDRIYLRTGSSVAVSGDSILPDPPDLNVTAAPRNLAVADVLAVNDDRGVGANPNNNSPIEVVPDLDLVSEVQKSPKRP
ncbi:hypothetical protein Droror1_Dr00006177 [Drosera rotundifolia]